MKNTKLVNAVAYARIGEKNHKSNSKIKWQFSKIEKYAQENGYVISKKYIDKGFSGNAPDRPALHQLHEDAKLGEWKIVLVSDMSRLARDSEIYIRIKSNLQKNGVEIVSINDPNKFLERILTNAYFVHEHMAGSEDIKAGIARRKQRK